MKAPQELIALALDIVSTRLLILIAMVSMLGLACWVMWQPDYWRLLCLALWGIFVFLPVVKLETQQKEQSK